jgi:hypothetical protein
MTAVHEPAVEAMLRELREAGVETEEFATFRRGQPTTFNASRATPILLRLLPVIQDKRIRESIVRSLTNEPEARRLGAAAVLVEEFRRDDDDLGVKWAIGNALATLSNAAVAEDLITLLRDKQQGKAREMLCQALKTTGIRERLLS